MAKIRNLSEIWVMVLYKFTKWGKYLMIFISKGEYKTINAAKAEALAAFVCHL